MKCYVEFHKIMGTKEFGGSGMYIDYLPFWKADYYLIRIYRKGVDKLNPDMFNAFDIKLPNIFNPNGWFS